MALNTYAALKTAIADLLARSDLTSYIPDFITLAESELNATSRLRSMITTTTVTPSAVNKYIALPTGFIELISFSDDLGEPLIEKSYDELESLRYGSGAGRPRYFAIGSRIDFERLSNGATTYPIRYYQRLDIANTLNDTLLVYPGLYLYGAALHAAPFIQHDERMPVWRALYDQVFEMAQNRETMNRRTLTTEFGGEQFNVITG